MKRAFMVIAAAIAAVVVLPIAVATVSAHTTSVNGAVTCESDGTFTVDWTIRNDSGPAATIALVSASPSGSVTGLPAPDVEGGQSVHAAQTAIPGSATSASLTVVSHWSDANPDTQQSGFVELGGECEGTSTTSTTVPETTTSTTSTTIPDGTTTTTTAEKTLTFQVLGPICVADHPYIRWQLGATGLTPEQNVATITITDINGVVVETLTNQPFNGQTLWPGASVDPEDWPGWVKIGGVWYVDPSDAVLRQGVYVRADVNPTAGPLLVAYPEATAACAQPEMAVVPTTTSRTSALPVTGSSTAATLWIAVGFLGLGGLTLAVARRRRHPA